MAGNAPTHVRYSRCRRLIRLLFLLLIGTAHAQQYPFIRISAPDAPKGAGNLFEDSDGGLWIVGAESGEGLSYFDGTRFFSPLKNSFPKFQGSGIAEDSETGIWIASSAGLFRYYQGQLQKVLDGAFDVGITKVAPNLFLTVVRAGGGDSGGTGRLIRVSKIAGQWKTDTLLETFPLVKLQPDQSGSVLFACDKGYCEVASDDIARWQPGGTVAMRRYAALTRTDYSKDGSLVWRDRFNCVWMRSSLDVSYQCPGDKQPEVMPASIASLGISIILETSDGSVVLLSFNKLAIGRPGHFRVVTPANGYPSAASALVAKDGAIWLSNANGLYVFPTRLAMEFWSERDGLLGNTWSILPLKKETLAASGDTIEVLEKDRSRWRLWLPLRDASSLEEGPDSTILAASQTEGLWQVSAQGKVLRKSAPTEIMATVEDGDRRFWASGAGIYQVNFVNQGLDLQPQTLPVPGARIQSLRFDGSGGLWACGDSGLLHKEESNWRLFSTKDGLKDTSCRNFAVDQQQDIWYSYSSFRIPGLTLIRNPAGSHPSFQFIEGGNLAGRGYGNFFESDRRGWLWRGTPDGVYVADPKEAEEGNWLRLDRSDGLPAIDANQRSFREDRDGSVWFGADNSVIHLFPPDDLVHPRYSPSVFISAFSWNGGAPVLAANVKEFRSGSDLVAHVGSLQTDRRNALHLRYRLLPDQTAWHASPNLDLHLGKLHWGAHTLQVQAALGTGPWSEASVAQLRVLKPFWLSWPALIGFTAMGSVATSVAARWRRKQAQRAKKVFPEIAEWRLAVLSPEIQSLEGGVLDSRFEVGKILGRGGFATVAEGKDLKKDARRCAVKIFHQKFADKDWLTKRFRHEVLALEQIRHPNVVSIYGHGMTPEGALYLVMEFIEGQTMRSLLEAGMIPRGKAASYLRQTGSALHAIHAHSICHRDLKPENLMIRDVASPGQEIALIDFSIAIVKDPDETLHGLSRAAGTIYYMAPEQAIGYADATSDIYSLAKIVIEMLTGQRLSALLPNASIDLPERVAELLSETPSGLSAFSIELIAQALEYHPRRRPSDAREFANRIAGDLERGGKDLEARSK